MATAIFLLRAGILIWNFLPSNFAVVRSLPLQICDLAAICSAFALIVERRWLASIAYFWGLALSVQGLIQPDLQGGPATLGFWLFWLHHALIVGTALYLVLARGFRPTTRDFLVALRAGLAYAAIIFVVDTAFDVNYGYLGRALPSQPTLLDWLGPWPWRALAVSALASAAMWVLLIPWLFRGRERPRLASTSDRR